MRLLKVEPDGTFSLIRVHGNKIPRYAILSHTWEAEDQEVTFQDLADGSAERKAGYRKIRFCGKQANSDGIEYFWVDSCCIDKSSSSELAEAINSMFRWYRNADRCYVYLSDVPTADVDLQAFRHSRWFTRGWTLQELLAPRTVEFFSQEGQKIGDKQSLELQIHQVSGIPIRALQQLGDLSQFSVKERMSWTARRETTVEEDQAYCLLGIFEVYLPLIYGEGREHALGRLQDEISRMNARDAPQRTDELAPKKADACLATLVPTDQARFLSQAIIRSKNGCAWIFQNQKYIFWHEDRSSTLLWITGKAGHGKTTLAAHICHKISMHQPKVLAHQKDELKRVVLYFFFQRTNDEAVKTAAAAFRTIIHQLVYQVPAALPIFLKKYDSLSARGNFEWSWENLSAMLGEMLAQISHDSRVYIVLDALDECEAESRVLILDWAKEAVDEYAASMTFRDLQTSLKILLTSRSEGDITDHLSDCPTIEITHADTANDIQALIKDRVERFAHQRHLKPDVTRSIIDFLKANAHGMFLWIILIMKELERRDERLSDEVIASKLSRIPLTLFDTYQAVIQNTPPARKQDMWRIYRWLLFGSRALTLAELETALCLETNASSWHGFAADLKFLCGSLIRLSGRREEVSFVHQTARAFVETYLNTVNQADLGGIDMDNSAANECLAGTCIQYLLRDKILELQRRMLKTGLDIAYEAVDQDVFLCYAIESWAFHTRAVGAPSAATCDLVLGLLSSKARRDAIVRLTSFISNGSFWIVPPPQTPLHLAAKLNIPWLVQMYISANPDAVHAKSDMNDTPLIWASEMGSTESVNILLVADANPNTFEFDGWSALHWAARNGHVSVATLLLEYGASLKQRDSKGRTPLDWAIDRCNWDVADALRCRAGLNELGDLDSTSQPMESESLNMSTNFTQKNWQFWDSRP